MAEVGWNDAAVGTASLAIVYTVPSGKEVVVSTFAVCNRDTVNDEVFDVAVEIGGTNYYLVSAGVLEPSTTTFFTVGLVLRATDELKFNGSSDMHFTAFGLERDVAS